MSAVAAGEESEGACWFCRRGRCSECMVEVPTEGRSEGPHDCSFGTVMVKCGCAHRGGGGA